MKKSIYRLTAVCFALMLLLPGCTRDGQQDANLRETALLSENAADTETEIAKAAADTETEIAEAVTDTEAETTEAAAEAYYYEMLSEEERTVYDEVLRALTTRREVSVSTLSQDTLEKVFTCVLNDHPEIFYVSQYIATSRSRDGKEVSLSFGGKYDYEEETCAERETMLAAEAERILSGIPEGASDYDKIKYIFDTLVNETEYVRDAEDYQNLCSTLLWHKANCKGYAKAAQYLLNQAGIAATLVRGTANGENHVWNLVMADGAWYYLDPTWGDVDYQSQREGEQLDKEVMEISYDYFLITSDRLTKTHTPDKLVPLPDCVAMEDNYYVHEGRYVTGLDPEVIGQIFREAYEQGEETVQFQCANDEVFDQVCVYLLEEQRIFDYVDALDVVPYVDNPEMNTFCFWL